MIEKLSTGIEGLDRLTDGGFLRGSAYIIQGPPGAGKTILANQFCYSHVRAGGRALYMSLLAESTARMLSYVGQMAFFDDRAVPERLQYISGYGVLEREGLGGLSKLIQHELKRHGATAMVLDGTFVAQSVASEQDFRSFIHGLQGVAALADAVLVMLTHQARVPSSPEHTMVDGWIELRNETVGSRLVQDIQVRKQRGANILGGKHSFRIDGKGIAVFPRLESCISDIPAVPAANRQDEFLSTGVAELDVLLGGGIPRESATLAVGPSGSGKTTLGMHFISQATVDEPALIFSFYENPTLICSRARSMGFELEKLIETGAVQLKWLRPSEMIVDEVAHEVIEQARKIGAKRVFVDGLVAIRDNLIDRHRFPYFINALSLQLRSSGAAVFYSMEIKEIGLDAVMPSDELSAMVDNVLLLNISRHDQALRRYLSVIKMRERNFDPRTQPFHLGTRGFTLGLDSRLIASGRTD